MKTKKSAIIGLCSALLMLILILDAKTALQGAVTGIEICLRTVIPSLFPFFFLSGLISSAILGYSGKFLRPVGKLCGIPNGAEPLLLLGLTGGYPVGAQAVHTAYTEGTIHKQDAERMLGFCNSAGPAFIFGMTGALFESMAAPWALWGLLILSALLTGMILPQKSSAACNITQKKTVKPMERAIKAMATVCGWVILFRVLLSILDRWIFWILPESVVILITGALELSNGCIVLHYAADPVFRFVAAAAFLTLGGACVGLQTVSVTGQLSCKTYFMGKLIQGLISIPASYLIATLLFPGNWNITGTVIAVIILAAAIYFGGRVLKNNTGNYSIHGV